MTTYTVKSGDTLVRIARNYPDVSWTDIRDANVDLLKENLKRFRRGDPRLDRPLGWWIFPGNVLVIPIPEPEPKPEPPKPGDPPPDPPEEVIEPPRTKRPKPELEKRVTINKYEYILGMYNTEIRETRYAPTGIYVSKPFVTEGNVLEVQLASHEQHPVFDITGGVSSQQTSIEYYVTYNDNPTPIEWLSILPEGQTSIANELLLFKNNPQAQLRFKARSDMPIQVYENGEPMPSNEWLINPDFKSMQIVPGKFIASKFYTISYTPDPADRDPWRINFIDEGLTPTVYTEEFEHGTNRNGILYLTHTPYVDYSKVYDEDYQPIQVTLYDANVAGPRNTAYDTVKPIGGDTEAFTKNVTDYASEEQPELQDYDTTITSEGEPTYLGFEYLHAGNRLYFTETFKGTQIEANQSINHGDAKIRVRYSLLTPAIRMKIILRNTSPLSAVTPIVNDYTLKFHVVR